ncbi:hypothetical protein GOB57_07815 [Sinorhizobium meliloti]|nr:hypothetical protein [Sinorhizobium meliloti]
MVRKRIEDDVVGKVYMFADSWRCKRAVCLLIGSGPGSEGEAVRIVGRPLRSGGFEVSYIRSYEPGVGHARRAYEFLGRHYGMPLNVREIVSEEGIGLHRHLLAEGVIAGIDVEREGFDRRTGEPMEDLRSAGPTPKR